MKHEISFGLINHGNRHRDKNERKAAAEWGGVEWGGMKKPFETLKHIRSAPGYRPHCFHSLRTLLLPHCNRGEGDKVDSGINFPFFYFVIVFGSLCKYLIYTFSDIKTLLFVFSLWMAEWGGELRVENFCSWRKLIDGKLKFKDNCEEKREQIVLAAICSARRGENFPQWQKPKSKNDNSREKFPIEEDLSRLDERVWGRRNFARHDCENSRCFPSENYKIWIISLHFVCDRRRSCRSSWNFHSLPSSIHSRVDSFVNISPIKRRFLHVDCLIRREKQKNVRRRQDGKFFLQAFRSSSRFCYQIKYLFYDFSSFFTNLFEFSKWFYARDEMFSGKRRLSIY